MSALLALVFNAKTLAAVVGYAAGAYTFPYVKSKFFAAEAAVKAVEGNQTKQ